MSEDIQDPLKCIDEINEPDVRQKNFEGSLEDRHAELSAINLNETCPIEVRQLFETAKNLSLYSWFVYRFHQVSELVSFTALEMALRLRYLKENPKDPDSKQRDPTLFALLQHAKKENWFVNDGFPSLYARAKLAAEYEKFMEVIQNRDFKEGESATIDDPTEAEIQDALSKLDLVSAIADNANKVRNNLAHGSSTLHPGSVSTLITVSEVISQVYP